ncbi:MULTISPECIES: YwqG family protein [Thermomonosporaceae]|uniref:YwqG family protein n=1 Tax=Thermomonosporaceae TaxID=2012 RepID=UPI00255AE04D|nr:MULTISPECIES: YwqG family protein [Thermomonosporaceae]MDL4771625.1 YwqG family protein [Actinomadura xylanilytica]
MDHFATQRQRLRSLFGVFFAPEVTGALLPLIRPALRLGADGPVTVRLGGTPLLPPDEPWPVWEGRPLDFLGAVDFAELAALGPIAGLPAEGTAAFYYASEIPRPWGDAPGQRDGWRVFTGGDLREAEPPAGTSNYPPCPVEAAPFLSLPSPQEPVVRRLEELYSGILPVYEQLYVAWTQYAWPDDLPVHQLGGWPALVQRPVGPDCLLASTGRDAESAEMSGDEQAAAEEEWRLLLQLDSDKRLGWHWGDPGRVYFCTRDQEPLERSWLTLQAT